MPPFSVTLIWKSNEYPTCWNTEPTLTIVHVVLADTSISTQKYRNVCLCVYLYIYTSEGSSVTSFPCCWCCFAIPEWVMTSNSCTWSPVLPFPLGWLWSTLQYVIQYPSVTGYCQETWSKIRISCDYGHGFITCRYFQQLDLSQISIQLG